MEFKVGNELAEYLLKNGYKELLGDSYLKYFEFNDYTPKRRRLFYIPRFKCGKFTKSNWRYIVFDHCNIVDYKSGFHGFTITQEKLNEIIKNHKK